jgi:preprotein translocase subunit YajC
MSYLSDLLATVLTLAQTAAPASTQPAEEVPFIARIIRDGGPFLLVGGFLVIYYLMVVGPKRKQEDQKKKSLDAVKKGDTIETIGGLIGTVVNTDEKTITIKADESNNTKLKFNRRAIHRVLTDEPEKTTK